MRDLTYAIVGGGAAAAAAVEAIRERDGSAMGVFTKEWLAPYQRPPLSKEYLQGRTPIESVLLHPAAWYIEHDVAVYTGVEIAAVDTAGRTLTLEGQTVRYERLLLATGAQPRRLSVPGDGLENVLYLRSAADAERLRAASLVAERVVVIGSGFIGMEVAASLRSSGCEVTVASPDAALYERFGRIVSKFAAELFTRHGVRTVLGTGVREIVGDGKVAGVLLDSGERLPCDVVVVGIGVAPDVALAQTAGLHVDDGIVVDAQLRSSDPHVFAAGDVARFPGFRGGLVRVEHFDHAWESGRCAGANMTGADQTYRYVPFFWSDVFELGFEFVGDPAGEAALVQGATESGSFVVEYTERGQLRGALLASRDAAERDAYRERIGSVTAT